MSSPPTGRTRELIEALLAAAEAEGAKVKFVAPRIGGFTDSKGKKRKADEKIGGGPSVLFDAVALVPGEADALVAMPPARDFIADAFAHAKFIALAPSADPLVAAAGLSGKLDAGCFRLDGRGAATDFIEACRKLRFWERPH